jgi:YD repeat-containing protein
MIVFHETGSVSFELKCNTNTCTGPATATKVGSSAVAGAATVVLTNNFPTMVDIQLQVGGKAAEYNTRVAVGTSFAPIVFPSAADPISTATGELVVTPNSDLSLGGPLPLRFTRYYSAYLNINGDQSAVGYNWMHNFDPVLTLSGNIASIMFLGGTRVSFQQTGSTWQTLYPARRAYQLVTSGSTLRFLDPASNLIYTFSSTSGSLLKIEDRNGNALTVTPSQIGPTQVSDGLGRSLSFVYADGFLTKVQDQSGRAVSFSYTLNDLTGVTDGNGNTTTFSYAPGDLLNKTVRPGGNAPYTQVFDSTFRVTQQTDSLGNKTTLAYNSGGTPGATLVTDPLSHALLTRNNPDPLSLASFTDAAGQSGSFTYDSARRPASYTDRLGNKSAVTYDPASGFTASATDAQGNTTTFTYQSQTQGGFTFYNLIKITFADGTSNSFGYDGSGNVLTATDAAGKTATLTYNTRGQALTATNAAGGATALTYNQDGTVATLRTPAGDVSTYSYDNLKRVAKVQHADQTSISLTRDALNQILSITNERGQVTRLAYDANTNVKSVTDALNQSSTASYDTDDLPSSATDPLGNSTRIQYDPLGYATAVTNGASEKTPSRTTTCSA